MAPTVRASGEEEGEPREASAFSLPEATTERTPALKAVLTALLNAAE